MHLTSPQVQQVGTYHSVHAVVNIYVVNVMQSMLLLKVILLEDRGDDLGLACHVMCRVHHSMP